MRRAAFASLASLTVHDKKTTDEQFLARVLLIEATADDSRDFVKKAVNWALRSIGKDALRDLREPAQIARVSKR